MTKVLIVDDHASFRQILKEVLMSDNPSLRFNEAEDGKEARDQVRALHPHLILMDVSLPDDNGLHLTKEIKAQHPGIIIFLITNHDLPEFEEAAYQMGADKFFSKNASPLEVSTAIKNYFK
jgi:DNA-binding NarL/FixJ family response regulator